MFGPDGPALHQLLRQALSSTERGYDLLAPRFDATPFRTPDELLRQVESVIGAGGTPRRGLDLCCGTGAGLAMLARVCADEVVGLDSSQGMLDEAARRLADLPGAPARLVRGDALRSPFQGGFDVVTCFGAFGHIREHEQPALLRSVRRAMAPDGRFVFLTGYALGPHRPAWWLLRGFNAAMHVRNRVVRPPFHMYYLNFTVPDIVPRFEAAGMRLVLHPATWHRRSFVIGVATPA